MRPWPFSTVCVLWTKSGGGVRSCAEGVAPPRALISSGGKSVAEGDGEIGHQGRLVGFDGEQIVALSVPDGLADRPLAERRIARDDGAPERKTLEQRQGGHDLVAVRLDLQLTDHPVQMAGEGRHQMHPGAAIVTGRRGAPQALAIQRDVPERVRAPHPFSQHGLGRLQVQSLEK